MKKKCDIYDWHGWRQNELWTLEIHDLYHTNLKTMQKLWKFYFVAKKTKIMSLQDVIDFYTGECNLDLLPEQLSSCWGMSKSTVNNDVKQRKQYYEAPFVEFLEFFARLARLKFRDSPTLKNSTLAEKIMALMDLVFPAIQCVRKEVVIEVEYVSCSEEELIEDKYFI